MEKAHQGEYLGLRVRKWQENGRNCIRSSIIYTLHKILE
jgi:hypothetical protein